MHIALAISSLLAVTAPTRSDAALLAANCQTPYRDVTVVQGASIEYPDSARDLGLGAVEVRVEVTIGPGGNLIDAKIMQGSNNMAIDETAIAAARQSTYAPAIVNCTPVQGDSVLVVPFDPSGDTQIPSQPPTDSSVTPQPRPAQKLNLGSAMEAALAKDATFSVCRIHHATGGDGLTPGDVLMEFQCAYNVKDYRAAEALGELLVRAGVKLAQRNLYWLANAYHIRGNNKKALDYARLAYSHITAKDKARCQSNVNRCADLRALLIAIQPSYRSRFVAEDSAIRASQQEAAAQAAEAAREAAATAFDDSGTGIHSTEYFHVNGEWELDWSYDCSNFADGKGNFIVEVDGDVSDVLVNELGSSNSGTEYVHSGGDVYLKINSECDWTVKAVNE